MVIVASAVCRSLLPGADDVWPYTPNAAPPLAVCALPYHDIEVADPEVPGDHTPSARGAELA